MSQESESTRAYFAKVEQATGQARAWIPELQTRGYLPPHLDFADFFGDMHRRVLEDIAFKNKFRHPFSHLVPEADALASWQTSTDLIKPVRAAASTLRRELASAEYNAAIRPEADKLQELAWLLFCADEVRTYFQIDVEKPVERTPAQEAELLRQMDELVGKLKVERPDLKLR